MSQNDITSFFPEQIRGFVSVGAQSLGCDESYIAVPLLPVLASAIGNTRRIRLKGSWTEPAVVWAGINAESGTVKSPALELATRPVWRRMGKLLKDHGAARAEYDRARGEWKSAPKGERGEEPQAPAPCEHPICSDITTEAMATRLLDTPRGTLLAVDELAGWLGGFDQYKNGGCDVAHWLSMFGARVMKWDRKTGDRTTIYVPHAAVSITGTIQPATLRKILAPEFFANGLAARLLMVSPPMKAKRWTESEIPDDISRNVNRIFDRLYGMQQTPGVEGENEPVMVDLTDDARGIFASFVNEWNEYIQTLDGPARASGAKMEGYAARFALIRHCVRQASGEKACDYVDREDVHAGIDLAHWFADQTFRTYRMMAESKGDKDRREMLEWVAERGGKVSVRDLQRGMRRYAKDGERAERDLDKLVREGMGSWEHVGAGSKGGRPTRVFCLAESPDYSIRADADTTPETNGNRQVLSRWGAETREFDPDRFSRGATPEQLRIARGEDA